MPAIKAIDEPRPRGTVIGRQVSRPLLSEAEHFKRCPLCHGYVDMRDRVWLTNTNSRCRIRRKIGCSSVRALSVPVSRFVFIPVQFRKRNGPSRGG